jgi:hypothetical protein
MGKLIWVVVDPGICGFECSIEARRVGRWAAGLQVQSQCEHIQRFSDLIPVVTVRGLFAPMTRNPVLLAAEQAHCHASCPVPVAVLKAAEVALEMALPRDVRISFRPPASVGVAQGQDPPGKDRALK